MALGAAHALAALLLEHADLRAARLAVDDADDAGVGDERRAGEHLTAVLLEHSTRSMLTSSTGSESTRSTVTTEPGVTFTWRPPL